MKVFVVVETDGPHNPGMPVKNTEAIVLLI